MLIPTDIIRDARRTLSALLFPSDRALRPMARLGLVLAASGLAHVLVWLACGAPSLLGPVSWRKPIVFGLSGGIATLSLVWVLGLLPASDVRRRWARIYAWTMGLEILLIDVQRWRGVGSHFNVATRLDGIVFNVMGVLIVTSAVALFMVLREVVRARTLPSDQRAAAALGLGFVLVGCAIGVGMSVQGSVVLALGTGTPAVIGGAGLLKVSHGVALHALQTLPVLGWLLAQVRVSLVARTRWIVGAGVAQGLLVISALVTALAGRGPLDPTGPALGLGLVGLLILGAAGLRVVAALLGPAPERHVRAAAL